MIADLPLPEPEDTDDARLLRALERDGWICRGASPSTGDPAGTPRFAYTAGLERTWGHPELIILGVDWPDSYGILEASKRFYRMAAEAGDAEARRRLDELA